MSLVPYSALLEDDFFDRLFASKNQSKTGALTPRVDITENNDNFLVTAELPGVKKENMHIHLEDGILSIEAETREEHKKEENGKIISQERRYGKFTRSFTVGKNIQESDITANYSDGILSLTFPKSKPVSPSRKKIEIG